MVAAEGRADHYDKSGVLRDTIQNHMFQMMAYLMMEPPASFQADAIRNEKSKLLDSVRIYTQEEALANTIRGQYGAGKTPDGSPLSDYRATQGVNPNSGTPTYAGIRLPCLPEAVARAVLPGPRLSISAHESDRSACAGRHSRPASVFL